MCIEASQVLATYIGTKVHTSLGVKTTSEYFVLIVAVLPQATMEPEFLIEWLQGGDDMTNVA